MSNRNVPVNPFKKGNQYYKTAAHTGRPKRYATPEDLWEAAIGYFTWCSTTPVITYRSRRGKIVTVLKNREMSLKELHKWLGICNLNYYKKLPLFTLKVHRIQNVVAHYNYVHAAAGVIKGRSVGHALRKEHPDLYTQKSRNTYVRSSSSSYYSASCQTRVGSALHVARIKNEKACVDTRKVRIEKFPFAAIAPLRKNYLYKSVKGNNNKYRKFLNSVNSDSDKFINTRKKIVILRPSKNRIANPDSYSKEIFHPPKQQPELKNKNLKHHDYQSKS